MFCKISGCRKKANRVGAQLCEVHYYRMRRTGHYGIKVKSKLNHSHGYIISYVPGHPLGKNLKDKNRVFEHRVVFYTAFGDGPFSCHWCKKPITWGDMHIDHLDEIKTNNSIDNLVPSCPVCNQARGRNKMVRWSREHRAIKHTFNGVTKSRKEWADDLGISRESLRMRIRRWPIELALTKPRSACGPANKREK
jgi:5-methylcytosine-specific restriction endonuclease McrA